MNISGNKLKFASISAFGWSHSIAAAFCLSAVLSAAQAQPPRAGLEQPGAPTLVNLGDKVALGAQMPGLRALLAADAMLDLGVADREVREDLPAGQALGAWLRQRHGLPPAPRARQVWVLLGRDGRALASGVTLPTPGDLVQALEGAGERNPVTRLQAFLKERPGHAEARMDLIQALQPRLQARLQEHPAAPGQDLPPEEDARVWGLVAQELDLLFQDEDWLGLNLKPDRGLLPAGVPEQASPLMKAMYRRHHPRLLAALQRFPENPAAWFNLLRMDQALGEQELVRALEGIAWFRVRPVEAAMLPYGPLALRLHQEAKKTGQWRRAMVAERSLWQQLAQPKLAFFDKASLLSTGASAEDREKWRYAERDTVWTHLLAPLIEAMVRAGSEGEVVPLLGELDETWAGIGLNSRLMSLARTAGRPDLARSWAAAVQAPPAQFLREGLLGYDRLVFHQGQQPIEEQTQEYDQPFRKQGMEAGLQPAPASWAKRLGWPQGSPRWAMVDARGHVLLQGERLPSGADLLAAYRAQGLPMDLERVAAFRQEHPEHLGALAIEVRLRGTIAWAHHSERCADQAPDQSMGGPERDAWSRYFAVLERLLDDPLGSCPGLMRTAQVHFPTREELGKEVGDLGVESLSRRLLPRLESRLAKRPSDTDTWWLWLMFSSQVDRPLAPLLDSLAPSPLAPPLAWPPQEILTPAAEGLRRQERWQDLADLLQPRWLRPELELGIDPAAAGGAAVARPDPGSRRDPGSPG